MKKFLASALGALLAALPGAALATILFAGGEDVDFNCGGTCTTSTTAGHFRSDWARSALFLNDNSLADPPTNRIITSNFAGQGSIWVHGQYINIINGAGNASTGTNSQLLRVMATDGNPAVVIRGTGTGGQVKISTRSTAGVFVDLVTCGTDFPSAILDKFDFFLNYSASGEATIYKNGTSVCTYSGDVTTDGRTQVQAVELYSAVYGTSDGGKWSEVIVATTDTRGKNLLRLTPNGAGNAVQWDGTNPCTDILDNDPYNDASVASTPTNDELLQCTVTNTIPAGSWRVDAVSMSTRMLRGATGPQNFQFVTRTGGTDYFSSDQAPSTSFSNFRSYIQETNPGTATTWSTSDLTAVGFNIGLKSRP